MTYIDQNKKAKFVDDHYSRFEVGVPILHWQLRDLIRIDEQDNIYLQNGNILKTLDPDKNAITDICELENTSVSISYYDHTVALGGNTGKVHIITPTKVNTIYVEDCIINSVHITCIDSRMLLFTCSNNNRIKVFDLEKFTLLDVITHDYAINTCEVSRDGKKMMISSCDSNNIFKYYYEAGSFRKYESVITERDSAFSVSWSRDSMKYAVGTQDGYCIIWDVRMDGKLYRLESTQPNTVKGAIRTVNFSQSCLFDTILYTEHMNTFNVVDTRNHDYFDSCYKHIQSIRLDETKDLSISGAAFSKMSEKIYISTEDSIYEYKSLTEPFRTSREGKMA